MTCVESLENILHQIGLQGRTALLWSVVPTTRADFVKYRPIFPMHIFTGVSLSNQHFFLSINPKYDEQVFVDSTC